MEDIYNFQDIIKNSFLEQDMFATLSILHIVIGLLIAFLIGMFIFIIYRKTFRGVVYSHNFNVTLVLMTMITTLVIMTISTNVVLSLGMVGALSIVRFRTALKDPLDIVFMFWAIAGGIATGAGIYFLSIFGSIVIGLVVFLLSRQKKKDIVYLLVIHYEEQANDDVKFELIKLKYVFKSKIVRKELVELTVEIKLKVDNTAFVNRISEIEGVRDVSLVQYNGDYAA